MIRFLHKTEELSLIILLSLLTIFGFAEAIMRQLGIGAMWMGDLLKWISAWFLIFGMAYGIRTQSHIGLTILTDKINNPSAKRTLAFIAIVICIAYCIILFSSSWQYVLRAKKINFHFHDLKDIPLWIPYAGLLFGFILLLWRFLLIGWKILMGKADSIGFIDEAKDSVAQLGQGETK